MREGAWEGLDIGKIKGEIIYLYFNLISKNLKKIFNGNKYFHEL